MTTQQLFCRDKYRIPMRERDPKTRAPLPTGGRGMACP
jgi:hypothetical protein